MSSVLVRAMLIGVSVLAIVWAAGAQRSTSAYEDAVQIAASLRLGGGEKGDFERAKEDIERSRRFGSETRALRARALLLLAVGRRRAAAAVAEDVVRREPASLDAWGVLFDATHKNDPRRSAEALRRARQLNPLIGRDYH